LRSGRKGSHPAFRDLPEYGFLDDQKKVEALRSETKAEVAEELKKRRAPFPTLPPVRTMSDIKVGA